MDDRDIFQSVLRGQMSILSFEKWLYDHVEELESSIGNKRCYQLLDVNYKSKFVMNQLKPLLAELLEFNCVEDFEIQDLLKRFVMTDDDQEFVELCRNIYKEYCNGYAFFRLLALTYIVYDYNFQLNDPKIKADFLCKYRAQFVQEGRRLLRFLESGAIKITDVHQYDDFRMDDEKEEATYWS